MHKFVNLCVSYNESAVGWYITIYVWLVFENLDICIENLSS